MPWYTILFMSGGVLLLLCGGSLLLICTCLIVVVVQGYSMSPTLEDGYRVLALRAGRLRGVQKGQIVVFRQSPLDEIAGDLPLSLHIKRVVALAGETYRSTCFLLGITSVSLKRSKLSSGIFHKIPCLSAAITASRASIRVAGTLPLQNVRGIVVKKVSSSPVTLSAHVAIAQRRILDANPDRFHIACH